MTAEEIKNNNIIIAKFDGWKNTKHSPFSDGIDVFDYKKEVSPNVFKTNYGGSFNYNTSWDCLLPTYKKLNEKLFELKNKIAKSSNPNKHSLLKQMDDCDCVVRCHIWGVRIEDAFYGIAETIKLYNEKFSKYDN